MIELIRIPIPIQHHDISVAGIDSIPPYPPRGTGDAGLVSDAIRSAHRGRAVVARGHLAVEESPESGCVQVQVGAADDVLRQPHAAGLVGGSAPAEIRVAVSGQGRPGLRGVLARADALPVGCFRLLHTGVDIFGVVQVVVVEGVVLERSACKPGSSRGFDKRPATGGNVLRATALERMIGGPAPHVVDVAG